MGQWEVWEGYVWGAGVLSLNDTKLCISISGNLGFPVWTKASGKKHTAH